MTTTTVSKPEPHVSDATADRLRAFLASMRPLRDAEPNDEDDEAIWRGRSAIERLALSAKGEGVPPLRLSAAEVADVLCASYRGRNPSAPRRGGRTRRMRRVTSAAS